jgi:TBC1 domain family member 2
MGYLPNNASRRESILARKRQEYKSLVEKHFGPSARKIDEPIFHQISIDVPRTCPELELFRRSQVKDCLIRILYCWSIRRPASGYVQGINDLVTPFFQVFYGPEIKEDQTEEFMDNVEADTFWCFSKLLDSIQDNYTASQSGIHRQIGNLKEIVSRIDPALYRHFEKEHIDFVQFAFRWMNCLLHREFPLHLLTRLFDTYMAEGEGGFSSFHTFVCAAFLLKWSEKLQLLEFQDIIIFLQSPPTSIWTKEDIETLLSEAFVLKSLFLDSLNRRNNLSK